VVLSEGSPGTTVIQRSREQFDIVRVMTPVRRAHTLVGRIRHEIDPRYLLTDGYQVGREDRETFFDLCAHHDAVWIHSVKTANRLGIDALPNSVLDIDDLQSSLYSSAAQVERSPVRKLLYWRMVELWKRRERLLPERFGVLVACSENDKLRFGTDAPVTVVPNGFSAPRRRHKRARAVPVRLGFVGTFQHQPNVDGLNWFLSDAWPRVREAFPEARLRLMGRGSEAFDGGPGVDGLGWVKDSGTEISSWALMVIPVRVGGGTRIKMAEAFARECPVVSTSLGAFGYRVRDREHLVIADNPAEFARGCIELMREPEKARDMASRAYELFRESWTWDSYCPRVKEALQAALGAGPSRRQSHGIGWNGEADH
jgi:polysaccharide biosynthesis protein PslH